MSTTHITRRMWNDASDATEPIILHKLTTKEFAIIIIAILVFIAFVATVCYCKYISTWPTITDPSSSYFFVELSFF